jgi:uncharacterized protein YgbK (DUF1537 family)
MSPPLIDLLSPLPPVWPEDVLPEIQRRLAASGAKVVVLDDDPTGTQTVHGIAVLAEWSVESLRAELSGVAPAFYVLTNSRALPSPQAQALNAQIARNLREAAATRHNLTVISRSDSTLRGHFPAEVDALARSLLPDVASHNLPPCLIIPAFLAGGRYTIDDVHYVAHGDDLVPAGETEFARDAAFGYRSSNLRDWVEEKTDRRIRASRVASISIDDIRHGGPERVEEYLAALPPSSACVVNAAAERDLEVVALAALACELAGRPLLYRTAASFARARAGITLRPLLEPADLWGDAGAGRVAPFSGGLIVVGSHVPQTTTQLLALLERGIDAVEVDVEALLDDQTRVAEMTRCADRANALLSAGRDALIYTGRWQIRGPDADASLAIGQRVSDGLVAIVRNIVVQPRYVLTKGGITSSDTATRGLDVRRAMVLGQLLPGVPAWRLGPESRYPGSILVIFPGNVGGPAALAEARDRLAVWP